MISEHKTSAGGRNIGALHFGDNQSRDCLSVYQEDDVEGGWSIIHICDWEAFKAAGDKHQSERTETW